MPSKITPLTNVAEVGLSGEALAELARLQLKVLSDFHETDVAPLFKSLPAKDAKKLFKVLVGSGVDFTFDPQAKLADLGLFTSRTLRPLAAGGYEKLADFEGKHFPAVYDIVGYGTGKAVLLPVILSRTKVLFSKPEWSGEEWRAFVETLVSDDLVSWEDIAVAVLAELNPPQVGTAVANAVKHNYPPRETMREVWKWFYAQSGRCEISGKHLFLEADHKIPKEEFIKSGKDVKDADTLDNFQLLTKRENVIKRGSHRLGGISFANAAAVLMYVLLRFKPSTLTAFAKHCREHGLTMSGIRFQEAWAMAIWLARDGRYKIDGDIDQTALDLHGGDESEFAEEVEEVAEEVDRDERTPGSD